MATNETIKTHLSNSTQLNHRTLFAIIGDQPKDILNTLYKQLKGTKAKINANILWCFKGQNYSSPKQKVFESDPKINYCNYKDTETILGTTYSMLVLDDFQSITPNILCRTIETIEGGGIIALLLNNIDSLRNIYSMLMDCHQKYCTHKYTQITPRFNERFILSLQKCQSCIAITQSNQFLPFCTPNILSTPLVLASEHFNELIDIQNKSEPEIKDIIMLCKTSDQAKAVTMCTTELKQRTLTSNIVVTSARGRGKSASLGLAIAYAINAGYGTIYVTAPSPDNLTTLFEFAIKGLLALNYQEKINFNVTAKDRVVYKINIFKNHRQTVQYIPPLELKKPIQTDLLVIDEAAAIPLPIVKEMIGPYQVILSSTINGYEGTGRSLSLKLVAQLRDKANAASSGVNFEKKLKEIQLIEPIRYGKKDPIEAWLTDLLCLDCTKADPISNSFPHPSSCSLYLVDRDTLFSYHKTAEKFLKKIMSLFVSSHYKNSPNDLHLLADAPAHAIFVLLPQLPSDATELPEVLCAIQVCYEGGISKESVSESIKKGLRPSGDLIPWTVIEQFQEYSFGVLKGARIVRIACHPDCQSMGYGSKAIELLKDYFEGGMYSGVNKMEEMTISKEEKLENVLLTEEVRPRKLSKPLLRKLNELMPPALDYLGTSYGITPQLYKFWARNEYSPVYLRQMPNEITGEYTCIMIRPLQCKNKDLEEGRIGIKKTNWCDPYVKDYKNRFMSLLGYEFRKLHILSVMNILNFDASKVTNSKKQSITDEITVNDCLRLESYCNNLVDYHLVIDIIPQLARLYFKGNLPTLSINHIQQCILLGMGLQYKAIETIARELGVEVNQTLPLLNKILRKINAIVKEAIGSHSEKNPQKLEQKEEAHMDKLFKELDTK